ncbi:MAG: alpha-galactosidase [Clostridia bacterium]|nr:alpha-galactosidase [Clostridia bacterium]
MDISQIKYDIKYKAGGKTFVCQDNKCQHFSLTTSIVNGVLKVALDAKAKVTFVKFDIRMPYKYGESDRIFVNGYQSWTDSMEYEPKGQMKELTRFTEFLVTKTILKAMGLPKAGDILFWKYPRKSGVFYGWSYGYVRRGEDVEIFGSLNERYGYTVVTFDCNNSEVVISKELQNVVYFGENNLLELAHICGKYDEAFDEYFNKMGVKSREDKKRCGYTSWYNYYNCISESVINRDLEAISNQDIKFDCFQIDDGYQEHIGDWLITDKKKFPNGMKAIADNIHSKGMIAGLWLAPFAGVKKSKLFREHPEWFIKDKYGKPYNTGHNWGGFYSLDIYNEGAREYIKHVFDTVLNDWGYDLVKLDFLYGACVLPIHNKTRGEIMCDAMDLLRECCKDKLILGCGVPLMPAFGKVDYCRIGSDVELSWKNTRHKIRDDVSTPHTICNTIFRRHLNGRAWMNDPDVFLLRDYNMKMSFQQRKLVAKINSTFGSLLFISDDVSTYNQEQKDALKATFAQKDIKIISAEFVEKDVMKAVFEEDGKSITLKFNVRNGEYVL